MRTFNLAAADADATPTFIPEDFTAYGEEDFEEDTIIGDPPTEPTYPNQGAACTPYGAAIVDVKPYWYIVEQEDLSSFWQIPTKFNLPAQKGTGWTWHELRNANLDWPGGFVTQNTACVLQGLYAGAKLHVPASWPEPKPGVRTEKKQPGELGAAPGWLGYAIAAGGVVTIGGLAWIAYRQGKKR